MATMAAAVASSVLTFVILIFIGWIGPPSGDNLPLEILIFLSIVFIWGPAFALVPAAILALLVGRPMARRAIASGSGLPELLVTMIAAAALLWLILRATLYFAASAPRFVDLPSLGVFLLVGLCSALSWWFLVVLTERRA